MDLPLDPRKCLLMSIPDQAVILVSRSPNLNGMLCLSLIPPNSFVDVGFDDIENGPAVAGHGRWIDLAGDLSGGGCGCGIDRWSGEGDAQMAACNGMG